MTRAILLSLLMVAACGPVGPAGAEAGSSGEGSTTTEAPPTSGTSAAGASSGGTTQVGTSSSGAVEDGTFIVTRDMASDTECDVFAQDCPEGQKCSPYANDGGGSWNDVMCVPVMEDPAQVGEECFVVGNGVSGIDNCEAGAMCWDVDFRTSTGTCVAFCTGTPEAPMCAPKFACTIWGSGVLILCLPQCDPLEQDCAVNDVCLPSGDVFLCALDASGEEGQVHDSCMFANSCDPGLMCVVPSSAEECDPRATGCCEPFCDVTLANTCPGVGQVCNPLFEPGEEPAGFETVGFCAVPE
jgi:hypothetical protein